jgi:hypothetical protein
VGRRHTGGGAPNHDGWDLPPPPAQRQRMQQCHCPLRPTTETTKTRARDNATRWEGGGNDKGRERSVDDARWESGEWWRRDEMAADGDGGKGEKAACREVSIRSESESSKFWASFLARWKKYWGNSKTTNPTKLPVSKKTAQIDVTAETALKSVLKEMLRILF